MQRFEGFTPDVVYEHMRFLYSAETPVTIDGKPGKLGTLSKAKGTPTIEVAAVDHERPRGLAGVAWIVDRLLAPDGCPWDRAQTHESLKRHLLNEAYELIEAIDKSDREEMVEELGDVLLQPFMHTQIAKVRGDFDIDEVAEHLGQKLYRRHPHVFADVEAETSDQVLRNWDDIKEKEKHNQQKSILDGVPVSLPSLLQAYEVSVRAARKGFEWGNIDEVWRKVDEERSELEAAIISGESDAVEEELGDLLFTIVNIARWLDVEPEGALRKMLNRFRSRYRQMEFDAEKPLNDLSPEEWLSLWKSAKNANVSGSTARTEPSQES